MAGEGTLSTHCLRRQRGPLRSADAVPVDWVTYWRQYRLGDQLGLLRMANPGDRSQGGLLSILDPQKLFLSFHYLD